MGIYCYVVISFRSSVHRARKIYFWRKKNNESILLFPIQIKEQRIFTYFFDFVFVSLSDSYKILVLSDVNIMTFFALLLYR